LFDSPRRQAWTYTDATGAIGPGGIEIAELAVCIAEDDPNVPDVQPGERFELSRSGLPGIGIAAAGRVLARRSASN